MSSAILREFRRISCSLTGRFASVEHQRPLSSRMASACGTLLYCSNPAGSYEDAVSTLNSLQTNAAVLSAIRKERGRMQRTSLPEMAMYISRIGLTVEHLDRLKAIHVSGTKGKGSTCAFVEGILRHAGFKTGLYTSPHLVEVRERIRINGKPISHDMFAKYFFECYHKLLESASENSSMPGYFRFLTLMAFYVFLLENVDVAVIEVGIGGSYDCTNILQSPVVCGISSLGLDHTAVLGDTIQQIAWHKSGIMKNRRPSVTTNQSQEALQCLFDRSFELNSHLSIAPPYSDYNFTEPLGLHGNHQFGNASLAIQLCRIWMTEYQSKLEHCSKSFPEFIDTSLSVSSCRYPVCVPFTLPQCFKDGLTCATWPGRCQMIHRPNVTIFLDGAHTRESMEACVAWFKDKTFCRTSPSSCSVLLFNLSSDRDPDAMYQALQTVSWHHAVFCPSIVSVDESGARSTDSTNFTVTHKEQLTVCLRNDQIWTKTSQQDLRDTCPTSVFASISDAMTWIVSGKDPGIGEPSSIGPPIPNYLLDADHINILVTGSLHLVGGMLRFLGSDVL